MLSMAMRWMHAPGDDMRVTHNLTPHAAVGNRDRSAHIPAKLHPSHSVEPVTPRLSAGFVIQDTGPSLRWT